MIGTTLSDRYEILAELGRGAMGVVYRARDRNLRREVAVKILLAFDDATPEQTAHFDREAMLVASMSHPAIVPVFDYDRDGDTPFCVMELVRGRTLRQAIHDRDLSLGATLQVGIQVAEGLAHSHTKDVIHRDVKPGNLMLCSEQSTLRVRIMDFGLARELTRPHSGGLKGTVPYMSPEQILSRPMDGRSDLYALGAVLYECLAGRPPFHAMTEITTTYRIVSQSPRPFHELGVEVDTDLEEIVLDCLARDPADRPATGEELAARLRACEEKLASETGRPVSVAIPEGLAKTSEALPPPLIGYRRQWRTLEKRLRAADHRRQCQLVLIGGDEGAGKTRLLEELGERGREQGLQVLCGRIAARESTLPYQGLCELIQDYFRGRDAAEGSSDGVELTDLAADLLCHFPALGEIDELRRIASEAPAVRPEADKEYLYDLLATTLARIRGGKPMLLLLENLHAGDVSIGALDYIVRRLGATPTLVAGTYRSGEIDPTHPLHTMLEDYRDDSRAELLELGKLSSKDFREWVEWLIDDQTGDHDTGPVTLGDEFVDTLYQATAGNRFFAQEMVRSLVEDESLSRDEDGRWVFSRQAELKRTLPATIRRTVEKRIDSLPEEPRRVLRTASVLGTRFYEEDLAEIVEDDVNLDRALDVLIRRHLLKEDPRRRDQLSFESGVFRDVVYLSLRSGRRRRLHRRHAERLEDRFRKRRRLSLVYAKLVRHFALAEEAEKTVTYGLELARKALDACHPEEAVDAVGQALRFVDEVPAYDVLHTDLRLLLARAHRMSGDLEQAVEQARKAFESAPESAVLQRTAAALLAAETAWQGRQVAAARSWVDRGLELARIVEAPEILRPLLTLGATLASLRWEHELAEALTAERQGLTAAGHGGREEPIPAGGVLVTVLPNPVVSLDPARFKMDEEREVEACVYDTLVVSGPDGGLLPALAKSWQSSPDSRFFELVLRPKVFFSDGTPLLAGLVKVSLERSARDLRESPPAALEAIAGFADFQAGRCDGLAGIEAPDETRVTFRLDEPLPIFPAILTHPRTAIVREVTTAGGETVLYGTGPFHIARYLKQKEIVLERNPRSWRPPAPLKEIVFAMDRGAPEIASGLKSGEIDLGRDLLPEDLEKILRDPDFRSRIVETVKKNVYFVLCNTRSPVTRDLAVRQALLGVIRPHDLVTRTLGRFAQRSVCLIPPGMLGHDPGRRPPRNLSRQEARRRLAAAGFSDEIKLRAAVHPLFRGRCRPLWEALAQEWADLGVAVSIETRSMSSFLEQPSAGVDLWIGRWNAVYDDPDMFTYALFHSVDGVLRDYYCSPEADEWMIQARNEEDVAIREMLYRRLENLLTGQAVLLPLFHEVDYRIAGPRVRGVELHNTHSYVNYATLGTAPPAPAPEPVAPPRSDAIRVAIGSAVETLDPAAGSLSDYHEVIPNVFETLTRVEQGTRIVPWLATVEPEGDGTSWRVALREGVRFHDGRRLHPQDVRYSFERLLKRRRADLHYLLLPIRGARALRDGEATQLAGFEVLTDTEIRIELERPLAFFDALLSSPTVAIVPQGSESFSTSWHDGCAGTGAFQVVRFDPGNHLVLEKNPDYWRADAPRSERLEFYFGFSPERTFQELVAGRLSLAKGLRPADVETLSRDERFDCEPEPRLATYFLVPNTRSGPFVDAELRRAFVQALDVERLLRETRGRRQMAPTSTLTPLLLLGGEARTLERRPEPAARGDRLRGLSLQAARHPIYAETYAAFWESLCRNLRRQGLGLECQATGFWPVLDEKCEAPVDLYVGRWLADYPDPDGFVGSLLHSEEGALRSLVESPEIDQRIERGRQETDAERRLAIYWEIEEILAREALVIPLFSEQICCFTGPGIEGLRVELSAPEVRYDELTRKR